MSRPGTSGRPHTDINPDVTVERTRRADPGRILCRSAHFGGDAVGAYILRRRRAPDLMVCECCSDIIVAGTVVYDVERHDDGRRLVVCADCVGEP